MHLSLIFNNQNCVSWLRFSLYSQKSIYNQSQRFTFSGPLLYYTISFLSTNTCKTVEIPNLFIGPARPVLCVCKQHKVALTIIKHTHFNNKITLADAQHVYTEHTWPSAKPQTNRQKRRRANATQHLKRKTCVLHGVVCVCV